MVDFIIVQTSSGSRENVAADDISGKKHLRTKLQTGDDGTAVDVGPSSPLPTTKIGAAAITSGTKTVTTAGTAVRIIVASTPCKRVRVAADTGNQGIIMIGDSSVVALVDNQLGTPLFPGNPSIVLEVSDLNLLWIDAEISGERLTYNYEN